MVLERAGEGVEEKKGREGVGRRRKEGGIRGRLFTPRLLIPLLKGFCSIMPDSFRK